MIILTRLGGHQVAVNPDLIERAEATPDTVITMLDGHKLVVTESVLEVVDAVRTWRASIAAEAYAFSRPGDGEGDDRTDARTRSDLDRASELSTDDVAVRSAVGASLARVLRMPLADRGGEV